MCAACGDVNVICIDRALIGRIHAPGGITGSRYLYIGNIRRGVCRGEYRIRTAAIGCNGAVGDLRRAALTHNEYHGIDAVEIVVIRYIQGALAALGQRSLTPEAEKELLYIFFQKTKNQL